MVDITQALPISALTAIPDATRLSRTNRQTEPPLMAVAVIAGLSAAVMCTAAVILLAVGY